MIPADKNSFTHNSAVSYFWPTFQKIIMLARLSYWFTYIHICMCKLSTTIIISHLLKHNTIVPTIIIITVGWQQLTFPTSFESYTSVLGRLIMMATIMIKVITSFTENNKMTACVFIVIRSNHNNYNYWQLNHYIKIFSLSDYNLLTTYFFGRKSYSTHLVTKSSEAEILLHKRRRSGQCQLQLMASQLFKHQKKISWHISPLIVSKCIWEEPKCVDYMD